MDSPQVDPNIFKAKYTLVVTDSIKKKGIQLVRLVNKY